MPQTWCHDSGAFCALLPFLRPRFARSRGFPPFAPEGSPLTPPPSCSSVCVCQRVNALQGQRSFRLQLGRSMEACLPVNSKPRLSLSVIPSCPVLVFPYRYVGHLTHKCDPQNPILLSDFPYSAAKLSGMMLQQFGAFSPQAGSWMGDILSGGKSEKPVYGPERERRIPIIFSVFA
jgi:hypothetical protein